MSLTDFNRIRQLIPALTVVGSAMLIGAQPKFEVASIKPCRPDIPDSRTNERADMSPERLRLACSASTVKGLIQMAYVLFANGRVNPPWGTSIPILGGPAWINSDRYEIDAKAETPQSQGMMHGPMLQTLLEDRFKLKLHRETGDVPVYELTVSKSGLKIQPFQEGSCTPVDFNFLTQFPPQPLPDLPAGKQYCGGVSPDGSRWIGTSEFMKGPNVTLEARGMTLDDFCKIVLGNRLDRPVINKTGITRRFVFRMEFKPDETTPKFLQDDDPNRSDGGGPSIFTALQEQLGLKLVSGKGPGEFLVIDSVQRPSAN